MPFLLYDVDRSTGVDCYTLPSGKNGKVRKVKLAGKKGPFAQIVRNRNGENEPYCWHASADDLVRLLGANPVNQQIVIDLKPKEPQSVSLYRLLDVWGYSKKDWTALALCLEVFFADENVAEPKTFKKHFKLTSVRQKSLVGEFLYVRGGTEKGTWGWGKVGRVNGVLLRPDAFDYLVGELRKALHVNESVEHS